MEAKRTILIIEDDQSIREVISHHLSANGFDFDCAEDGMAGLEKALAGDYALVILDLNLPKLSGLDVCKALKKEREHVPIIMLTSREAEIDRVVGFEIGADDYVVKPFGIYELIARIRARLRSPAAPQQRMNPDTCLTFGPISLYPNLRKANVSGTPLDLTRKEFDVLEFFIRNPERSISRSELLEMVWGSRTQSYEDTVTTVVGRLRRKIEALHPDGEFIQTVRGIGFRLSADDPGAHLTKKPDG